MPGFPRKLPVGVHPPLRRGRAGADQRHSTLRFSFGDPGKQPDRRAGRQSSTSRPLRAVETQFRSSAPACDKSNFQKSGIPSKTGVARRAEGPAHPEHDRKCCDRNKTDRRGLWWTERVGVPSFGTVRLCESARATGPAQAPARIYREKKRRHKILDVRNDTGAVASATPKR